MSASLYLTEFYYEMKGGRRKILTQFDRILLRGGKKFRVQKSLDTGTLDSEGRREAARGGLWGCGWGKVADGWQGGRSTECSFCS